MMMSQKKTALQRLAFKIAENIESSFSVRVDDVAPATTEEIYRIVYAVLPFDQEDWAAEQEAFVKTMESGIIRHLEAAIKAANERDMFLRKEQHGCSGAWCEECQPALTNPPE